MPHPLFYHLIVTLPIYLLLHAGLAGMFKKAGQAPWKAFVPVLNSLIWLDMIGKPKWWVIFFLIPFINLVMGINLVLNLLKSFGKHNFVDHFCGVIFPFVYFLYLGWNKKDTYRGPWCDINNRVTQALAERKDGSLPMDLEKELEKYEAPTEKSSTREWLDAFLFAGSAALVIRTFMIEAFMIPTTSMEGTLLAGDFLFVSKMHYGVRMPMVPVSFPFVHNTLPFSPKTKSYLPILELPYSRFPGFTWVKRNDIVVFNYPADDIVADPDGPGLIKETSMKQNYIKRCVAVPGDTLQIINADLYINGERAWEAPEVQYGYSVSAPPEKVNLRILQQMGFRFNKNDRNNNIQLFDEEHPSSSQFICLLFTSPKKAAEVEAKGAKMMKLIQPYDSVGYQHVMGVKNASLPYPNYYSSKGEFKRVYKPALHWTLDNYGPIVIPKKGMKMPIDANNVGLYERCIRDYEGHTLETQGTKVLVDGQPVDSYTFEMDYFWMMGDNRHQSLDSRFWGFVPETHIVGRPWFVLFSYEGGVRWSRFMHGMGSLEP